MDSRLDLAPEVECLHRRLGSRALGLFVGGSIASRDYRPGISDIDAVALVNKPPRPAAREELISLHTQLAEEHSHGEALHCVYVPLSDAADPARRHWTWAFGEMFRRPLSRIARAELLADPVMVFGPEPRSWLPPMNDADLRDAAREQLAGYWTRALRKRAIWHRDVYVDQGLTVWARAEATISEGRLITKTEAIARMRERGVPGEIVDEVARRRAGRDVTLSNEQRESRAFTVRRFLKSEFVRLLDSSH